MNFHDDESDDSSDDLDEFMKKEVRVAGQGGEVIPVGAPPPLPAAAPPLPAHTPFAPPPPPPGAEAGLLGPAPPGAAVPVPVPVPVAMPVALPPTPAPVPAPAPASNPALLSGIELLQHPGPLPKRPKGSPPAGFPPLSSLLASFLAILPPGTPLPEGLVDTEEEPTKSPEKKQPEKPKKKRFRQIGEWVEFQDEEGKFYYQNLKTKAVQWDTPKDFGGTDWVEYKTAEGEAYFYNITTKETVWDKPEGMKAPSKPSFIKEIESSEKKRKRSEKVKEQGVQGQAPTVGQVQSFVLPMTEVDIRRKNLRDRELREKRRAEKEKRVGQGTSYLTTAEREREEKRKARKEHARERENQILAKLRDQAEKRKLRENTKQEIDLECDSVSSPVEISSGEE